MNPDTVWQRIVLTTYGVVLASVLAWSAKISGDIARHSEALADLRAAQSYSVALNARTEKQLSEMQRKLDQVQADIYQIKIDLAKIAK